MLRVSSSTDSSTSAAKIVVENNGVDDDGSYSDNFDKKRSCFTYLNIEDFREYWVYNKTWKKRSWDWWKWR